MPSAIILSAGQGLRLRPITDKIPKPLCIYQGKPLIEHHILRLRNLGFNKIIINHAHLGYQLRQFVGCSQKWGIEIIFSPEPPGGLETGGGISHALPHFNDKPFLAINGDIYTDYNFSLQKLETVKACHLILTKPKYKGLTKDYGLTSEHLVSNQNRAYVFTGIAYYHPKIFKNHRGRFSVTPLIRQLCQKSLCTGEVHEGAWNDLGVIERF